MRPARPGRRFRRNPYASEGQMLNELKKLSLGGCQFSSFELVERIRQKMPMPLDMGPVDSVGTALHRGLARTQSYGGVQFDEGCERLRVSYLAGMDELQTDDVLIHESAHLMRRHAIPVRSRTEDGMEYVRFLRPPAMNLMWRGLRSRLESFEITRAEARNLIRFYERDAIIAANHLWLASKYGPDVYRRDEKLLGLR